ncbi:MAG: four-helix bundle copper-binding protein [Pseudobdellovibrionaceae bacterium]
MEKQIGNQKNEAAQSGRQMNASMQACIDNCIKCFQICEQTIIHCLTMGGKHVEVEHMKSLQACAEICETSAKFMMLESPFHNQTCGVCAEVCKSCADSCEKLGGTEMQECADMCRQCAESCEAMAKMQ